MSSNPYGCSEVFAVVRVTISSSLAQPDLQGTASLRQAAVSTNSDGSLTYNTLLVILLVAVTENLTRHNLKEGIYVSK